MKYELTRSLTAADVADRIDARLSGPNLSFSAVAAISDRAAGALTFWHSNEPLPVDLPSGACVIINDTTPRQNSEKVCYLICRNPRLAFIRLLHWVENEKWLDRGSKGQIHSSATVHPTAVIDSGARIGAGCQVGPHVHITSRCYLGQSVRVGSGCVIGQWGFGYERDEHGVPVSFPHLGGVIIETGCEIGSNSTIACGNLNDTRIGRHAKIDDQVYIAHNCVIGESTMVAGGARVCGGVVIGARCWIGAGAMIRQGLAVGDRAVVGLGAVVVHPVATDTVVVGNPATVLRQE